MALSERLKMTHFFSNETYPEPGCADIRWTANFDGIFNIQNKGSRMVNFKGNMFATEPWGGSLKRCVVKVPRRVCDNVQTAEKCAEYYMKASDMARSFAKNFKYCKIAFNQSHETKMENVSTLSIPLRFGNKRRHLHENDPVVFEKYISGNFKTYVTRNGDVARCCPHELESFCHYTYNRSGGQFIPLGIKGVYKHGSYLLTTPCIQSVKGEYGPDDEGPTAINRFFKNHTCNYMCKMCSRPSVCNVLNQPCLDASNGNRPNFQHQEDCSNGNVQVHDINTTDRNNCAGIRLPPFPQNGNVPRISECSNGEEHWRDIDPPSYFEAVKGQICNFDNS